MPEPADFFRPVVARHGAFAFQETHVQSFR